MATIPQYGTSPGAVPSPPSGSPGGQQPHVSGQMNIPTPPDSSQAQAAGAALESQAYDTTIRSSEKLAAYGEQFADQYIKAKLNVDAADRTADLSKQLHEAEFESSKIADRTAATADFDARAGRIKDAFAAQDVNPRVRAAVDAALPNQIALRRAATQQASFGLESQAQVAKLIANIDQYNKQAVDSTDPRLTEQLIGQANDAIDGRVAGGWLHADVAAKMKVDFGSNVYRTKIEVAMQKDMASGVALYEATKGKLNGPDGRAMAVMAADRTKQLDADQYVTQNMPGTGQYGNVTQWGGHIEGAAAKTGLTAPLIAAVASQESGGRADAVSPAGARGPMQFMPGTAAQMGLKPGEEKDPAKAIAAGAEYLKQQMDKYGDKTLALMAYNWGPGNVDKWIKDGKPAGAVPAETRNYVASVLAKEQQFGGTAGPEQAEAARLRNLDFIRGVQNDLTIDPEKRARILTSAHQRLNVEQGIQAAQAAQAKDQAEQAAVAWSLGKYKDGTWQQLADTFGKLGDFGQRDAYQGMADNESMYKNFGAASPEEQRRMAPFLAGPAGKIAQALIAEGKEDRAVIRADAGRSEEEAKKLLAQPDVDPRAAIKASEEAITGYLRAGTKADIAKAEAVRQSLTGMIEGKAKGNEPVANAQAELARLEERFQNGGYTHAEVAQAGILRKQMEHTAKLRKDDPIQLANMVLGPLSPFPFQGTPDEQAKAVQARTDRARWIDKNFFPGTGQPITPIFTAQEIAQQVQVLRTGSVQNRQQEAQRMAAYLPKEQILIIAKHLAGEGQDGLSSAIAEAIPLYASGDPQNIEIAHSIIRGANRLYESGEAGKLKTDATLQPLLTNALAGARISGGWDGRDIKRQDHAVMSRYTDLRGAKDLAIPDTDLLNQAIKDVVGEPYASRSHGDVVLPKGVDSSTFNDGISLLKPTDLPALQPARDGRPITAERIKAEGIFATVGNGVFKIRMKDPTDGIVRDLKQQNGQPVIIDMKPFFTRALRGEPNPDRPTVGSVGASP